MNVLQDIPTTWVWASICDVCSQPQYGYTTKACNAGDLRLLRTSDITSGTIYWDTVPFCSKNPDDLEKYMLRDGDILVSRAGSVGVSHLITKPPKAIFASYLIRFKPFIDKRYLAYFLQSPDYWITIADEKLGIAVPNVNATKLKSITVPVPPAREQGRIVAKIEELFSELDKGVESLKTAQAKLNVYRQTVLKHAFEGKLTAKWREENKDKLEKPEKLLARIKQERAARYQRQLREWETAVKKWEEGGKSGKRPRRLKNLRKVTNLLQDVTAKLPPLPDSWVWEKLGQMTCGVEYGTAAKSVTTGTVPVLRMGNIQNAKFDWTDLVYTSDDIEIAEYLLHDGDVLFNRTNSPELVGKTAIYKGKRPAIFAGYLIRVNHIRTVVDGQYLNLFINSHLARQYGKNVKTDGVNQSNINGSKLSDYPFPYCSIEEQHEIANILEKTFSLLDETGVCIVQELQKANSLHQSILKKAFAGQLVAQEPNDEPASILLDRIRAEREKAVKKNHTKKSKKRKTAV